MKHSLQMLIVLPVIGVQLNLSISLNLDDFNNMLIAMDGTTPANQWRDYSPHSFQNFWYEAHDILIPLIPKGIDIDKLLVSAGVHSHQDHAYFEENKISIVALQGETS